MKHHQLIVMILIALSPPTGLAHPPAEGAPPAEIIAHRMARDAQHFLDTLRPSAPRDAQLTLDADNRTDWNFVPLARQGLAIGDMSADERIAAHALFRSGLSARGYLMTGSIMELETVLREMAMARGRRADFRDPERYYVTIFGEPSTDHPWAWRLEGHHLSLNFTVTPDHISGTPAFFGANPAQVPDGRRAGWRVLADEEDIGRQLMRSLSETQHRRALIDETAPPDVLLRPGTAAGDLGKPVGLPIGEMTASQAAIANALINTYLATFEEDLARAHRQRIDGAGIAKVRFAWAGSIEPGKPHYYRLHGPTFVIEYDNTQDGANHVHTVYRDLERDFGGDTLRDHLLKDHHPE